MQPRVNKSYLFIQSTIMACGLLGAMRSEAFKLFGTDIQENFYSSEINNTTNYYVDTTPIAKAVEKANADFIEQLKKTGGEISDAIRASSGKRVLTPEERLRMQEHYSLKEFGPLIGIDVQSSEATEFVENGGLALYHKMIEDRLLGLQLSNHLSAQTVQSLVDGPQISGPEESKNATDFTKYLDAKNMAELFEYSRNHRNETQLFSGTSSDVKVIDDPVVSLATIKPEIIKAEELDQVSLNKFLMFTHRYSQKKGMNLSALTRTKVNMNPQLLYSNTQAFRRQMDSVSDPRSDINTSLNEELKTCDFNDKRFNSDKAQLEEKLKLAKNLADQKLVDLNNLTTQTTEITKKIKELDKKVDKKINELVKKLENIGAEIDLADYDNQNDTLTINSEMFIKNYDSHAYKDQAYAKTFKTREKLIEAVKQNIIYNQAPGKKPSWLKADQDLLNILNDLSLSKYNDYNDSLYLAKAMEPYRRSLKSPLSSGFLENSQKEKLLQEIEDSLNPVESTVNLDSPIALFNKIRELKKLESDIDELVGWRGTYDRDVVVKIEAANKASATASTGVESLKKDIQNLESTFKDDTESNHQRCLIAQELKKGKEEWIKLKAHLQGLARKSDGDDTSEKVPH